MNLIEFQQAFSTEEACILYLKKSRWSDGVYCPHCGSYSTYTYKDGKLYKCKDCQKQFTIKVGTIFEGSKVPLTKWFLAVYLSTSLKKGISSVQLSKYAGVTQKTAWFMLQRLRYAIEDNSNDILSGEVEVDEAYIGIRGNGRRGEATIFGAAERGGRVRITHVQSAGSRVLIPKIKQDIRQGSRIYSDKAQVYTTLGGRGYTHFSVNHSKKEFARGIVHIQHIEGAWSHFKRSIYGVYHAVSIKHLQKYCSEFEYRYSTRTMDDKERFDRWFKHLHARLRYNELIYGTKTKETS